MANTTNGALLYYRVKRVDTGEFLQEIADAGQTRAQLWGPRSSAYLSPRKPVGWKPHRVETVQVVPLKAVTRKAGRRQR
jgi:hypothetical protein